VITSLLTLTGLLQESGSGSGLSILVLQMAAIGLVFYFLILRPSGQARKRHAELLSKLKKGDEVMTNGGIIGRVKDIKEVDSEGLKEVRVTVESGSATVVVERSRIVRVGTSAAQVTPPS
jgi:preprotein translocase subunit YajC